MLLRRFAHHPIAMFFGDDGRRRNARLKGIAADNGPRIPAPFGPTTRRRHIAIDQHFRWIAPKLTPDQQGSTCAEHGWLAVNNRGTRGFVNGQANLLVVRG